MSRTASRQRAALADVLEQSDPEAPTLCVGWTAADLAAHLVLREHQPAASIGVAVRPLAGVTDRARVALRDRLGHAEMVRRFRAGPPRWSPMRLAPVDEALNAAEYFVHAEDVRRALPGWEPRPEDPHLEELLWRRLRLGGRVLMRRSPVPIVFERARGDVLRFGGDGQAVTVRGPASELLLLAFGRGRHARVDVDGAGDAVEAMLGARFGW